MCIIKRYMIFHTPKIKCLQMDIKNKLGISYFTSRCCNKMLDANFDCSMYVHLLMLAISISLVAAQNEENVINNASNSSLFEASWESLDKREIPEWYDQAKVGVLVHWGVHSVPSFYSERLYESWKTKDRSDDTVVQFMNKNYPLNFTYHDFGHMFKAEFFDANRLMNVVTQSGAKYVIFVAKHHDGYCMWPSKFAYNWHVGATGPKRDLLYEMINAARQQSELYVGVLYSMLEWTNDTFMAELNNPDKNPQTVVKDKLIPELYYLVERYQPDLIRGAGSWLATSTYYNTESFIKWLYNQSPIRNIVVINDQWGHDTFCQHGGYFQCDNIIDPQRNNTIHKFEYVISIDRKSWSYRRDATANAYLSIASIMKQLVNTVCSGGNAVISMGLTKEGFIPTIVEQRLYQLGSWLNINSEAIYGTKPWVHVNDSSNSDVCYTSRTLTSSTVIYAIFTRWPKTNILTLSSVTPYWATTVKMLPYPAALNWTYADEGIAIRLIPLPPDSRIHSAWALRIRCIKMYAPNFK